MKERKRKGHGHRGNVKRKQAYILGCIICVLLGLCFGIMWKEHNWNKSFSEPSEQNRETVSGKQAYNDHLSNSIQRNKKNRICLSGICLSLIGFYRIPCIYSKK